MVTVPVDATLHLSGAIILCKGAEVRQGAERQAKKRGGGGEQRNKKMGDAGLERTRTKAERDRENSMGLDAPSPELQTYSGLWSPGQTDRLCESRDG